MVFAGHNGTETYTFSAAGPTEEIGGRPIPPDPNIPPCPDVATAPNGDTIEIRGEGMLSVHPKSATGEGTFVHKDPQGNVFGTGAWEATELLSFKTYGPGDDTVPEDWRTGKALIRVHLTAASGFEADGILTVGCVLPGARVPGGLFEGATLQIQGGQNFNKPS